MAQVTVEDLIKLLRAENPEAGEATLLVYADALRTYVEATTNVNDLGAVVAHPRTGAPIENPFVNVRTQHGKVLERLHWIKAGKALALAQSAAAEQAAQLAAGPATPGAQQAGSTPAAVARHPSLPPGSRAKRPRSKR